jgi:hypothetical protein
MRGRSCSALQSEVQRLDGVAGVLLQTGLLATAGALTVVATVHLPRGIGAILGAAGAICVFPTIVAATALSHEPTFHGLAPDEPQLKLAYERKRTRCRLALISLTLTIELSLGIVGARLV